MNIINKPRGTGKTVELIYASEVTGARIITETKSGVDYILQKAKELGCNIPTPYSRHEYMSGKYTEKEEIGKGILVDDIEFRILKNALESYFEHPVIAVTMSVKESGDSND
jgi:hypothetical protein